MPTYNVLLHLLDSHSMII